MINKLIKKFRLPAAQGFTLIETLVAVFILVTAIAGPLTIASRGLTTALVAKDQVTAFYLAQDAVEYIRYKRDSACLASGVSPCDNAVWLSTVSACTGANGCYLDSTEHSPVSPSACIPSACLNGTTFTSSKFLYYDYSNSRFTYSATVPNIKQPFARSVIISTINTNEVKLKVTVSWSDTSGVVRSVVVIEDLLNWQ